MRRQFSFLTYFPTFSREHGPLLIRKKGKNPVRAAEDGSIAGSLQKHHSLHFSPACVSRHTPHSALGSRNRAGPAAPWPPGAGPGPRCCPFFTATSPPSWGPGCQQPQLRQGEEEEKAAQGSWRQSCPQHRPSCPCSRAALPRAAATRPGHHPQCHGCAGATQPENCRGKNTSFVEIGIVTSESVLQKAPPAV